MERNKETRERFVVFLDIMGFKDRVARNTPETLFKELTDFNRDITKIISESQRRPSQRIYRSEDSSGGELIMEDNNAQNIMLAQFSDSIVLFSNDNTKNSLAIISDVTSQIMRTAIDRDKPIPLKGALAEGIITCDMSKQLFFGQALIDAYLLEENVQYYGIVVHHTAEESVSLSGLNVFSDRMLPLKSGKIKHYELAWYKEYINEAESGLKRIRLSVSDAPRKYIDNTLSLFSLTDVF